LHDIKEVCLVSSSAVREHTQRKVFEKVQNPVRGSYFQCVQFERFW